MDVEWHNGGADLNDRSLSAEDVQQSFPELTLVGELGQGTYKTAFRARREADEVVLKVLRKPIVVEAEGEAVGVELVLDVDGEAPGADPHEPIEGERRDEGALASLQPSLPPRVQREIEAMRAVNSPRIVGILDGPATREIAGDLYWWYLEPFYPGGTLEARIARGPMNAEDATALCGGLIEAVEALWTQIRHVHRDVKPANVVFDGDGAPVLLDLGIALDMNATPLTDPGGIGPRTNRYCAPEQLLPRGTADLDARTDLFSVGVTVFEAWTGQHPFAPFDHGFRRRLINAEFDEAVLDARQGGDALKAVLPRLLGAKQHQRFRLPSLARAALREGAE